MKKGLIIALCVLMVLGAGAGFAYYRLYSTAQDAEQMQRTIFEQYEAMLQNAEQTTLTVTENGETVGAYTLGDLGLLDATEQAITAGFTADERMEPELFAQKSKTEKLEWRSQTHTQPGSVRADLVRYNDERVVDDLEAMSRRRAQDAYMEFDGEKFRVVDEVQGNELELEPVRAALREAAAALTVDASAPQNVSFEVTDVSGCYAQPEITAKNTDFDFNELLQEKLADVSVKLDLNLEGQTEQSKIVTLTQKELLPLVSVKKDGSIQVDEDKLDVLIAGWKALADVSNTSFILNTYVDGPKPMGFLKVDYQLDTESLKQTLTELKRRKPDAQPWFRVRLVVTGSEIDDPEFTKLIEMCGAMVVADRYCFGGFPGREEIEIQEGETAFDAICRHYLHWNQCVRFMDGGKIDQRHQELRRLVREYRADGVIYESMKFCEFWSYEKVLASHVLQQEMGIPCCTIEKEYNLGSVGQLRTRFQAFVESLEIKKLGAEKEGRL